MTLSSVADFSTTHLRMTRPFPALVTERSRLRGYPVMKRITFDFRELELPGAIATLERKNL